MEHLGTTKVMPPDTINSTVDNPHMDSLVGLVGCSINRTCEKPTPALNGLMFGEFTGNH